MFKNTVDSLTQAKGLAQIEKVKKLTTLAETRMSIPLNPLTSPREPISYRHYYYRTRLQRNSPSLGMGSDQSQHFNRHPWCIRTRTGY